MGPFITVWALCCVIMFGMLLYASAEAKAKFWMQFSFCSMMIMSLGSFIWCAQNLGY